MAAAADAVSFSILVRRSVPCCPVEPLFSPRLGFVFDLDQARRGKVSKTVNAGGQKNHLLHGSYRAVGVGGDTMALGGLGIYWLVSRRRRQI
jgi:hypothetical protein